MALLTKPLREGDRGSDVARLQAGLAVLALFQDQGIDRYGPKTEDAVEALQKAHGGMLVDGVFGRLTAEYYNQRLAHRPDLQIVFAPLAEPETPRRRLALVKCDADKVPGEAGFNSCTLREDAALAFKGLADDLHKVGAVLTSAGGVRPLTAGGGSAQSATSLHYTGLAFDLSTATGMTEDTDVYAVEPLDGRRWRVWARCTSPEVPERTVQAMICATVHGKLIRTMVPITARFVDFTALAAKHGFEPIRARPKFFKPDGTYDYAEWWHFQCESVLKPGVSTFGGELLRVYDEATIRRKFKGNWQAVKGAVWGREWG